MTAPISPARLQVMWNRLLALVEEQGQTLIRAAFSPIVRECGDISAGIFDLQGRMLAQAVTGTPGHINTMAAAVQHLRGRFPVQDMVPGDIYMTNDPWLASGHLNDFLLMMPVFHEGRVVGFTSCTSHLVDLGGLGMGPEGSDVYDEGLQIPPCKLVEGGEINALLMEIVKANSREPIANEGDIYALIACCEAGAARLVEMMRDYQIDDLHALGDYIIDTSRRGTLEAIAEVPKGVYDNELTVDGYEKPLTLKARLTVEKDRLHLDFTGTSGCSDKGINVPLNYATAYSVFAMRCIIGSDIPNNAGSLAPFVVTGPPGCILNAQRPAPVAMRHTLGQMTPDLVLGCLHQALPDRVPAEGASCMYDLPMRHTADAVLSGGQEFAVELVHNGGTGARPHSDGLSATAYPSGVFGSQVEMTEAAAPVTIWRRELLPGSGGAGQYRGGLGQRIELSSSIDEPFLVFLSVERISNPALGRAGGMPGAPGRIQVSGRATDIPGKCELRVAPGERLTFDTPGGGGFGPPDARHRDAVAADLAKGLIDEETAQAIYGGKAMTVRAVQTVAAMASYALADLGAATLVSLAQNESAFPPSPKALVAGQAALANTALYPDPDWRALRAAIADTHPIDAETILCGAGSMELIGTLIRAFSGPGDEVLGTAYGYLFVATAAQQAGARYVQAPEPDLHVSVDAVLDHVTQATKIVFICNPGNPTGTRIPNAEITRLHAALPSNVLLVVDQAYAEFDDQDHSAIFALASRGDTVVTRTLSKAYGMAGARVGWAAAPPAIGVEMRKLLNPNNISNVAQAMAEAAMRDQAHMRDTVARTAAIRDAFCTRLTSAGLTVPPSATNFALIRFADVDRARVADTALRERGFLLRGMGGYGLPDCLRATIGSSDAMTEVANIMENVRHG